MKAVNKKQFDDITITTTGGIIYVYYSTEWEYVECNEDYVYIKFVEEHSKDCIIYNKDQVISIEIG